MNRVLFDTMKEMAKERGQKFTYRPLTDDEFHVIAMMDKRSLELFLQMVRLGGVIESIEALRITDPSFFESAGKA